jgi:hypothetical protein
VRSQPPCCVTAVTLHVPSKAEPAAAALAEVVANVGEAAGPVARVG